MRAERMLLLAEHLEQNVSPYELDMSVWSCETSACAMGHACSIPAFNEIGLRLGAAGPRFAGRIGFAAAAEFFEIDYDDAYWLFSDRGFGETPKQVAERLRNYVDDHS